ncbi:MAG: HAMP domain-containing histidine kinase [Chitinophagaceae bacterium]|nr:HAMP domain-containing histidine kinase [Chitinophagaceae bacterium]
MRAQHLKWFVLSASLLIGAIIITQIVWLNKVYSFEQKTFNLNVVKAIRGLYEDVAMVDNPTLNLQSLVEHPETDHFLFKVKVLPNRDTLTEYLKLELEDFDVLTDVVYAFYTPGDEKFDQLYYLSTVASRYKKEKSYELNVLPKNTPYIMLYFPHRERYVMNQMRFWIISSGALIVVLIGLTVSIFFLYRQKFLTEIQKDFVNNFTHEFKTPLAVVKIAAGVLKQEGIENKPEKLHKYVNIIENQNEHLEKQVEKLLNMAKTESTHLPLSMSINDINQIIRTAVEQLEPLAVSKSARIELNLEEGVLNAAIDPIYITQSIVNLVENSIKYSKDPKIIVSTKRDVEHISISVKDNGIGIDKKYHRQLFNKFFRVPTGDVHDVKGFGLGLNFVKKVIDAHHGSISLNSIPGIGTEFKIKLPI